MAGIFKAYDIRGIYREELAVDLALKIGIAFGNFSHCESDIIVGWDSRLSSPVLKDALIAGFMAAGCSCVSVGLVPTPTVYFASVYQGDKVGAMVTASHNPPQYNGFKLCRNGLSYSYETCIGEIEQIILKERLNLADWDKIGKAVEWEALPDYMEYIKSKGNFERKLKIVIDAGNGTCGFSKSLFEDLGCDVKILYPEPDGRFPNHVPDPLNMETLKDLGKNVIKEKANIGIAFDGDGDRIGFVDENGRPIHGDFIFILFAREILMQHPRSKIVFNVLNSKALQEEVEAHGGTPIMTRVGHSYIQETLVREKAALAGEISGHYYFGINHYGYDDGILTAVKMIELLSKKDQPLSKLVEKLPRYSSSPEIRIQCSDIKKFRVIEYLKNKFEKEGWKLCTIDGIRVEFEDAWGLVRASNTEPTLVLRFEAKNKERLDSVQKHILKETKKAIEAVD